METARNGAAMPPEPCVAAGLTKAVVRRQERAAPLHRPASGGRRGTGSVPRARYFHFEFVFLRARCHRNHCVPS